MKHESTAASPNRLASLNELGQSIWLDFIRRNLLGSEEFQLLLRRDLVMGVTSNPAIFEKAIASGDEYRGELQRQKAACAADPKAVYEQLALADIRRACALLQPTYAATKRRDGYVSLEVSPKLAHDTAGTLEEARRLWGGVGAPNLMIKVPATAAGVPAIRTLISEGINVNVTLLFADSAYRKVAEAYTAGLEELAVRGGDLSGVASVASFFVSRVDSAIDPQLDEKAKDPAKRALATKLRGKIAIANAKLSYQSYAEWIATPRWKALARKGAQTQRLLWASTGTKDAKYSDVLYVEELIGRDTVNTVPPQTLDAFRDHGRPRESLAENTEQWLGHLRELESLGISLDAATAKLLDEGVKLFDQAFDKLLAAVAAYGQAR
jgi:transaldolase/glucose-6-phosphate isomerase